MNCPTCHRPTTELPALFCWGCRKPVKRGEPWHHVGGVVVHEGCARPVEIEAAMAVMSLGLHAEESEAKEARD